MPIERIRLVLSSFIIRERRRECADVPSHPVQFELWVVIRFRILANKVQTLVGYHAQRLSKLIMESQKIKELQSLKTRHIKRFQGSCSNRTTQNTWKMIQPPIQKLLQPTHPRSQSRRPMKKGCFQWCNNISAQFHEISAEQADDMSYQISDDEIYQINLPSASNMTVENFPILSRPTDTNLISYISGGIRPLHLINWKDIP